ncbi:rhomboid family intramembrane serine protease [Dichotomicrobium thermohalophilum]|uniref:Membrane associated rhomboid family serine protease n=1 Tax=Dichotomicrobium thermohalophilum TaxID=933063 RepID=A0A397QD64_9HYPH|nr:rhomboid family intramembrane serine protease [Dichotomicrobium thermohalophilum]RIA56201.1 membrane associated rhomboid family serine protease [Dichotomicrobium thermohalophilum]
MIPIRDSIVVRTTPSVVYALIIANVVVFLFQISMTGLVGQKFIYEYALVPLRYSNPVWAQYQGLSPNDYFPFISSFFMHGGFLHILLNMWTLYIFGSSVESRYGSVAFFIFYILCGIAANIAHFYFNQNSPVPVLGASGAVAGVMGAYAATFPRARLIMLFPIVFIPLFFELPALSFVVLWFGLQVLQGAVEMFRPSMGGGIAWWAHIGGFVAGMVLLPLLWLGGIGRKGTVYDARRGKRYRMTTGRRRWRVPNSGQRRQAGTEGNGEGPDQTNSDTRGPWGGAPPRP